MLAEDVYGVGTAADEVYGVGTTAALELECGTGIGATAGMLADELYGVGTTAALELELFVTGATGVEVVTGTAGALL